MKFVYKDKHFDIVQSILAALTVYNLILWILAPTVFISSVDISRSISPEIFFGRMMLLFYTATAINSGFIGFLTFENRDLEK